MKKMFLGFAVLLLLPLVPSQAEAFTQFGMSPSQVLITVPEGERVTGRVSILRSEPEKTQEMTIVVDDEGLFALPGEGLITLQEGQQQVDVTYEFLGDQLEIGKYETMLRFRMANAVDASISDGQIQLFYEIGLPVKAEIVSKEQFMSDVLHEPLRITILDMPELVERSFSVSADVVNPYSSPIPHVDLSATLTDASQAIVASQDITTSFLSYDSHVSTFQFEKIPTGEYTLTLSAHVYGTEIDSETMLIRVDGVDLLMIKLRDFFQNKLVLGTIVFIVFCAGTAMILRGLKKAR